MARRQGGLLAQIAEDVGDDRVSLSSLLQKCIVLGGQAGSETMRDWARSELNGYPGRDGVPDYRHVHAPVMAVITNLAGYNGIPTRIDPDVFSDQIRDIFRETAGDLEDAILPFGIGRLEGLASNGTDTHHLSTPSTVMAEMLNGHFVQPGSHVAQVYWSVSNDAILGTLSRIRTALADLVAELITRTPQDQDVPDKEAADRALQVVYNFETITGNVAAGSSGFAQTYSAGFDVTKVREFADLVTEIAACSVSTVASKPSLPQRTPSCTRQSKPPRLTRGAFAGPGTQ